MAEEGGPGGKTVGKISIKVVPDTTGFRRDLQRQLDAIEKELKLKIRVEADMDGLREKVEAETRGIAAKVKVDADLAGLREKIEAETRGISIHVKVKPDIDQSAFTRDKIVSSSGSFGGGAGAGLSGGIRLLTDQTALIAVAVVAFLAPALALLSTALVSLPALITAVALPLGVFAIGMGGIKKALEDSGILTDTKGKGGKDKIGLGSFLKEIQTSVSNVFEKGLTPLFRQLFDAFSGNIPILQRGLPFIAQGIVNFATAVTRSLSSVPNLQMLDRLTNSIGTMITNLSPGITSFSNAMIGLITNVGDHLPGLGTVMSQWAGRFEAWVTEISKPKNFWGKDIPGSSTLDSAVSNMKPVLESVINFVGRLTDAGLKMAANPDMANNIKTVVDGITNFTLNALPQLQSFFGSIADLMKGLGLDKAAHFDDQSKTKTSGSSPDAKPGGAANPNPDKSFKGNSVVPPIEKNSPIGQLHDWWVSATKSASGWLDKNIDPSLLFKNQAPRPGVQMMGPGGQQPATPPPAPAVPAVNIDGGAGALGGKVANQLQGVKAAVGPALAGIADGSDKVWDKLVEATKAAGNSIIATVQSWVGQIQGALAGLGPAGEAAGQALSTGMAAGIAAGASSAIAAAHALAMGVTAAAHTTLEINSPSKVFQGIGASVGEGFTDGLEGGAQGVIDAAHKLAQNVTDAVASHNIAGGAGQQFSAQIKDQLGAIGVEQDQLRAQKDGTTDKGQKKAIQGQMDQLNIAKDQLKAQSSQLGYSEKYGDSQSDSTKQQKAQLDLQEQQLKAQYDATTDKGQREKLKVQMDQIKAQKDALGLGGGDKADKTNAATEQLGQSANKMVDIGKNFAMANVNQFESDIGISGQGAIPTIANIGLGWATSTLGNLASGLLGGKGGPGMGGSPTHIHVNSIDEGLAAKQTLENRQALTNSAGR